MRDDGWIPESEFERMVTEDPERLIACLSDPALRPANRTFAAEHAGKLGARAKAPLLALLSDPSPLVKEGAMMGLSAAEVLDDEDVCARLRVLAASDDSKTIREIAACYLEPR